MNALNRTFRLAALLGSETAAVIVLGRLGRRPMFAIPVGDLGSWLRTTPPEDAFAAVLRVVALVATSWLLLTTATYALARLSRAPAALRATRWSTLPALRHVIDHALAASVAVGVVGTAVAPVIAPAMASSAAYAADTSRSPSPSGAATVRDGHAGALAGLPAEPAAPATAPSRPASAPTRPRTTTTPSVAAPTTPPTGAAAPPASVVVAPGDNLWELAAAHLARASGRPRPELADSEIARYWKAVCAENRARLGSGDPNLIYPGEVITFPAAR